MTSLRSQTEFGRKEGEDDITQKAIVAERIFFWIWGLSAATVDELWEYYKDSYTNKKYPVKFSFDQFIMALDYLYIIGAIREDEKGGLCYEAA